MFRKMANAIVMVWMIIVRICRSLIGKRKHDAKNEDASYKNDKKEWKAAEWEEWEVPDVKVEPATPTTPEEPPDLFKDMVPVIHTTKKINLKSSGNRPAPNLSQFAVDPTFTKTSSELLDWSDDDTSTSTPEGSSGWVNEENTTLPELLRQSRRPTGGRKKQREPPTAGGSTGLGATRIVSS